MKLRNKQTGEIAELGYIASSDGYIILQDVNTKDFIVKYPNLAEINAEWEDYEEKPEGFWMINILGIVEYTHGLPENEMMKEIGNYFETKEEAEKAVEKLKGWKQLKDKGFRFTAWKNGILLDETVAGQVSYEFPIGNKDDIEKDLDLLFGGEE